MTLRLPLLTVTLAARPGWLELGLALRWRDQEAGEIVFAIQRGQ
jgi:hypothetical protein